MIRITRESLNGMREHARRDYPLECCGVLGGAPGNVFKLYPLRNEASTPDRRYSAAPGDLFDAMRQMRQLQEKLVGIYHSHPRGPQHPSPLDVALSFYSDAIHFIITPFENNNRTGGVWAYVISGGRYTPVDLEIVDTKESGARDEGDGA